MVGEFFFFFCLLSCKCNPGPCLKPEECPWEVNLQRFGGRSVFGRAGQTHHSLSVRFNQCLSTRFRGVCLPYLILDWTQPLFNLFLRRWISQPYCVDWLTWSWTLITSRWSLVNLGRGPYLKINLSAGSISISKYIRVRDHSQISKIWMSITLDPWSMWPC